MTPGIELIIQSKVAHQVHEYTHDKATGSYGLEAAEKLQVPAERVFKTLVVRLEDLSLAVAVIPVSSKLSMKRFAKAIGARKAVMASKSEVERSTGYVLGGVSPLGQKRPLETILHGSAADHATIFVSAGRRGLEIELQPEDLKALTGGIFAQICQ